jgi:Flp pilus assembly protein TadB
MKAVNFVLGLGTAIILAALITLGIQAFYQAPTAPTYPLAVSSPSPIAQCTPTDTKCIQSNKNITDQQTQVQNQFNQQEQAYESQMQIYNRNIFIIANVIGMLIFALGFWLLFTTSIAAQSVPIGIMIAGLWSIIYGYARGWGSVNDQLKFFIGLVIAALVIGGSMWLIERYAKKRGNA